MDCVVAGASGSAGAPLAALTGREGPAAPGAGAWASKGDPATADSKAAEARSGSRVREAPLARLAVDVVISRIERPTWLMKPFSSQTLFACAEWGNYVSFNPIVRETSSVPFGGSSMPAPRFRGSLTALVTPFRDGAVDEDGFRGFIEWQIESGTQGLVPVGTTGESPTLSHEEHKRVVEICIEQAREQSALAPDIVAPRGLADVATKTIRLPVRAAAPAM